MLRRATTVIAVGLAAGVVLAGALGAAEKAMQSQAKKPAGVAATAAAAKAFAKVSAELYPKAKQEGNLIIYSVWDVDDLKAITEAFMKRYPGIKATYWQARNPEIITRALTEFQGGQSLSLIHI